MSYQIVFKTRNGVNETYLVNSVVRTLNPVNSRKYATIKGAKIGRANALRRTAVPNHHTAVNIEHDGYGAVENNVLIVTKPLSKQNCTIGG